MQMIVIASLIMSLWIFTPAPVYAENKPLKFAFFNNATPADDWWNNASLIMQAACEDFGIELDIYYAERNQFLMIRQFEQVISNPEPVNGVIFANMKQNIIQMLRIAEKAHIPAFIFNAGLADKELEMFGGPRQTFSYWVGQILPNDEQAGYDLAKQLFAQAKQNGLVDADGKIQVIGIGGAISDIAAIEREKGLMKAVKEDSRVMLRQIVSASWMQKRGEDVFLGLKSRYPDAAVVWAANDPMGLGAIDGIKKLKLTPGKDIIVGSIDWISDAVQAVQSGELSVSIGGHFLESAWSVILLYDYLNGNDFSTEALSFSSEMGILTADTIEWHVAHFGAGNWRDVNFKVFSKTTNPHLRQYNFKFDALLPQAVH